MNALPTFTLVRPTDRIEAAVLLADGARAIAGGTGWRAPGAPCGMKFGLA